MSQEVIGREQLVGAFAEVLNEQPLRGVVIVGAPGVGKSRLVATLADRAEAAGFHTTRLRGAAGTEAVDFAPFAAMLQLAPGAEIDIDAIMQVRAAVVDRNRASALIVDDAQLLDDASLGLVAQLADDPRVLVVLAVSSGRPIPGAIVDLWTGNRLDRHELPPLSRPQVAALAESILGAPIDEHTCSSLWRLGLGNPLLVRELLENGTTTGALAFDGSEWSARSSLTDGTRIRDVVERQLASLAGAAREALTVLAIADNPIPLDSLETIGGSNAVQELLRAELVEADRRPRRAAMSVRYPVHADVLRASATPAVRRTALERLVASYEAFESTSRDEAIQLATWRLELGRPSDRRLVLRAAERALAKWEGDLAGRLAEAVLEAEPDLEAELLLARARSISHRPEIAEAMLIDLIGRCRSDADRAAASTALGEHLFYRGGRPDAATATMEAAIAEVSDADVRDELIAQLASFHLFSGDFRQAMEVADRIIDGGTHSPAAMLSCCVTATVVTSFTGEISRCERDAAAGQAIVREIGAQAVYNAYLLPTHLDYGRFYAGRWEAAEQDMIRSQARLEAAGDHTRALGWNGPIGLLLIERGRVLEAIPYLEAADARFRGDDLLKNQQFNLSLLGLANALAGRPQAAREALTSFDELQFSDRQAGLGVRRRAEGWLTAISEAVTEAPGHFLDAATAHGESGHLVHQALALFDVVRVGGDARPVAAELERISATCTEPWCVHAFARFARAVADADATLGERAADEVANFGFTLHAADAWAIVGRMHSGAGDPPAGQAATARAEALFSGVAATRTPALQQRPKFLTRREADVARLAAAGLTSAAIADKLSISKRTVDNHLHRTYAKLGLAGRNELTPDLLG